MPETKPKKKVHKPGNKGRQGGKQPGAGHPTWMPNDAQREWVTKAARCGTRHLDIAAVLGIAEKTMRRAFKEELGLAATIANVEVGGALFQKATGRSKVIKIHEDGREETIIEAREPDTSSMIWWTKTRMGYKDTSRVEHTGAEGGPLELLYTSIDGATRGKLPSDHA